MQGHSNREGGRDGAPFPADGFGHSESQLLANQMCSLLGLHTLQHHQLLAGVGPWFKVQIAGQPGGMAGGVDGLMGPGAVQPGGEMKGAAIGELDAIALGVVSHHVDQQRSSWSRC